MRSGSVHFLVRQLRHSVGERTDADLVRRFATERDGDAFAELVQRHGSLVWGVCRRRLNRTDAEDAFQATFLVFARNAASIRKPESLGAWLHGVAYRVAQRMRLSGEPLPADPVSLAPSCLDSLTVREFLAALDDELAALPDKYRRPLVLCFLQERTQDDAAKRLGVSLSTLKRRLEAGRELLRERLTRRGVELPVALLAVGLGGGTVPAALAEGVVRAAIGGGADVSATVLTITEGVMRAMWETKLRAWVVGLLMATTVAGGTGYFAYSGQAQSGAGKQPANTPAAAKKIDPNERLRAAELDAAKAEVMIAEAKLQRAENDLGRTRALAQSGAVSATELSKAESSAEEAKAQLLRARSQFEIAVARMEAEKAKAAIEDDPRRAEANRYGLDVIDRYERAFDAQKAQPEIQKLREEKVKVMRGVLAGMNEARNMGALAGQVMATYQESYYTRSKFLLAAERELNANPQAQLKAAKDHFARMKELETFAGERAGKLIRKDDADAVTAYRLEAELWVKEAELGMARNVDPRTELTRIIERPANEPNLQLEKFNRLQTEELTKRLTQLEAEARANRDELLKTRDLAAAERQRSEELMRRVEDLTRTLIKEKIEREKAPTVPEGFRGTVIAVDGDLLTIEPGADAAARKGMVLEVFHAGTPMKSLGQVKILSVNPKEAVGRFTSPKAKPAADELPKVNDVLRAAK